MYKNELCSKLLDGGVNNVCNLILCMLASYLPYSTSMGRGKYWRKVYLERVVGKYLANLDLNKTVCAYIIVPKRLKIQYLKCLARRGVSPSFTCV